MKNKLVSLWGTMPLAGKIATVAAVGLPAIIVAGVAIAAKATSNTVDDDETIDAEFVEVTEE